MKRIFLLILLIAFILTGAAALFAQENEQNRGVTVKEKNNETINKRIALVIGNGAYQYTDALINPVNDASDMEQTLKDLGFEVISGTNQTKQGMEKLIRQFGNRLAETKGTGLFFYAGHGVSSSGTNYLIPVNADIQTEDEIEYYSVSINFVLNKMAAAKNNFNLLILDACRNNPFARRWRNFREVEGNKGLVYSNPPRGTLVLYATTPGSISIDSVGNSRNGVFTSALLKQIRTPNLELDKLVKYVAQEVESVSKNKQSPWKEGLYSGDFYFAGNNISTISLGSSTETGPTKPVFLSGEQAFWQEAERKNTLAMYESYVSYYPKGEFLPLAKLKIDEITTASKNAFDEAGKFRVNRNFEKAIEFFTKAIELNPKYEAAYLERGLTYYESYKLNESIEDLNKVILINPQNFIAYYHRSGVAYIKGKDKQAQGVLSYFEYTQALADINKYIEYLEKTPIPFINSRVYLLRGQIYAQQGELDLALKDFNKSTEFYVFFERGKVYLKKQEYDSAIADFTKALENIKTYGSIWSEYFTLVRWEIFNNRGKAYLGKGAYVQALDDLTKVIESNQLSEEVYSNRALAYDAIGLKKAADADRKKAAEFKKQK